MSLGYYENLEISAPQAWDHTEAGQPQAKNGNTQRNALLTPLKKALAVAYRSAPRIVCGMTQLPTDGTSIKIVDRLRGRKFVILDVPYSIAISVPYNGTVNASTVTIVPANSAGVNVAAGTVTAAGAGLVQIKGITSGTVYWQFTFAGAGSQNTPAFPNVTEGLQLTTAAAIVFTANGSYQANQAGVYLQQRDETIVNESGTAPQIQTIPAAFYLPAYDPPLRIETEASIWAATAVLGIGAILQYIVGIGEEASDT
jgi:hypothetical protein